jgi:hypothetical protein
LLAALEFRTREPVTEIRYTERSPKGGIVMPTPEERIAELAPYLSWYIYRPPRGDPIGMEYEIEHADPAIRNQLVAVRLETVAAVYTAMAEGAAKAAKIAARTQD